MAPASPDPSAPGPGRADRYRELFERSADAILIIDGETFIDCNDATVTMLRYAEKEQLLQTHPSELSPEFQPDGRRSFEKANEMIAIAFERGSHRFEWEHLRADGEVFPVEVLLTAVPEGPRTILHVVWRDITDRKQLEFELRHAQKMEAIGNLAGGVAHDFNNLLLAIMGYAELLDEELEDQPVLADQVREIHNAARRAADLTSKLLAFSRKQALQPELVDLNVLLAQSIRILQVVVGESVRVEMHRCEEVLPVKVDPSQIEQVLLNVATNARDAMKEGGTLTIRSASEQVGEDSGLNLPPGDYARVRIEDTGVGMAPEDAARAFDPFFSTKERGRGTGLGLASVYGIVTQSGGDVRIESSPGAGTVVEFHLPRSRERLASPPNPGEKKRDRAPARGTILVVEDEVTVAAIVRRILERRGYQVKEAANGIEALEVFRSAAREIDLLLTDVVMPGMGGPELARHVRAEHPELPVLFMSGYTDDALTAQGFDMEQVTIIRKPFTVMELIEGIADVLDLRA